MPKPHSERTSGPTCSCGESWFFKTDKALLRKEETIVSVILKLQVLPLLSTFSVGAVLGPILHIQEKVPNISKRTMQNKVLHPKKLELCKPSERIQGTFQG